MGRLAKPWLAEVRGHGSQKGDDGGARPASMGFRGPDTEGQGLSNSSPGERTRLQGRTRWA